MGNEQSKPEKKRLVEKGAGIGAGVGVGLGVAGGIAGAVLSVIFPPVGVPILAASAASIAAGAGGGAAVGSAIGAASGAIHYENNVNDLEEESAPFKEFSSIPCRGNTSHERWTSDEEDSNEGGTSDDEDSSQTYTSSSEEEEDDGEEEENILDLPSRREMPYNEDRVKEIVKYMQEFLDPVQRAKKVGEDLEDASNMIHAAKMGHFKELQDILRRKPFLINVIPEQRAWSVLHQVVYHNKPDLLKKLLEIPHCDVKIKAKTDRNNHGWSGITPIELAQKMKKGECEKLLRGAEGKPVEEVTFIQIEDGKTELDNEIFLFYSFSAHCLPDFVAKKLQCKHFFKEVWDILHRSSGSTLASLTKALGGQMSQISPNSSYMIENSMSSDALKKVLIKIYTGDEVCQLLNEALRRASKVAQDRITNKTNKTGPLQDDLLLSSYALFLQATLLFWDELPKHAEKSYRKVVLTSEYVDSYKPGVKFCWLPFTSSSRTEEAAMKIPVKREGCLALFEIDNSKKSMWSPRCVEKISFYGNELEVIHPSGARFQVTKVLPKYDVKYTKYNITLLGETK